MVQNHRIDWRRSQTAGLLGMLLSCWLGTANADSFERGLGHFQRENFTAAAAAFEHALSEAPQAAETYYYLGLSYAKLDRHAEAIAAFKHAVAIEPDLPGAHLSLGISYYQVDLYQPAQAALNRAREADPSDGSALLFLGLTASAMGDHEQAIDYFQRAGDADPDFLQLAQVNIADSYQQLGKDNARRSALRRAIGADPTSDTAAGARAILEESSDPTSAKRWKMSANVGIEFDDNVTTSDVDLTSGEEDYAGIVEFSAAYNVVKTDTSELELGYDFYQSIYADLSDFDLQLHAFSASGSHELGAVDAGLAYRYSYTSLGGDKFLEIHNILPSVSFSLGPSWFHNLTYSYQDKNFATDDERDADQHAVSFDNFYFFMGGRAYALLGVRLEDESTTGAEFDYFGHYVTAAVSGSAQVWRRPTKLRFNYQYYLRDYSEVTPSIGAEREDKRHTVTLSGVQPITDYWGLILSYQHIEADSNLPSSDFSENIVSVSIGATF